MAIPEQVSRLADGVSAWNAWRRRNPDERIDLSRAILHQTKVPWEPDQLIEYDLEGINLRGANLDYAVLKGANLRRSDLASATLRRAELRRADMTGASLQRANLSGANLTLTKCRDANLTNALFWETVLSRTDLRDVIGLDSARHGGPSIIDHRTVQRSGRLPREFLRGIGLPDRLIGQYGIHASDESFSDCFISYSSVDEIFVKLLHDHLQRHGIRCWYAPKDMAIGARTRQTLDDAIRSNERLIVVLSASSIASAWVEKEVETAFEEERTRNATVLLPIRIDEAVMQSRIAWASDLRNMRNIGNFVRWQESKTAYRAELKKLISALKGDMQPLVVVE